MDNILVWNVKGLNRFSKQVEIRKFITNHNTKLFSLLETTVKISRMGMLYQNVCSVWYFTSNSSVINKGRIVVGCRLDCSDVDVIQVTTQMIHCKINRVGPCTEFSAPLCMDTMIRWK